MDRAPINFNTTMLFRVAFFLSVLAQLCYAKGSSDGYANPKDNGGKAVTVCLIAETVLERAIERHCFR